MIEGYSEEFKANYSELKQTVDTIQEELTPVRLHLYIRVYLSMILIEYYSR